MALTSTSFSKCAPSLSTNIKQCGTVTLCSAKPLTTDDLTSTYLKSGDYKVMEALFHHDMEIKQCETVQNGIYDFLMANKVNMSKRITTSRANSGLIQIAPYVLARQYSPINNEYWIFNSGSAGANSTWVVNVVSSTNIPIDARSFPADANGQNGMRVYLDGKSVGGSSTKTAWLVISTVDNGTYLTLTLQSQNLGSYLPADKLGSPVHGILRRGTPNVSDYEKFCQEAPAYLNWKNVPFWVETSRTSMCKSSNYDKWRKLLLEDNALFREFGDLDDIQKNKQLGADWQRRLCNAFFWNKPISQYQTLADYDQLDAIDAYDGSSVGLGADGATCQGFRANAVGVYEQLAECSRIVDLQGAQLNLPALFVELYNMMRVREGNGSSNPRSIDIFTDSVTAELINQAMIVYYNSKSNNTLRLTKSVDRMIKKAEFGFYFEQYTLFWPQGMTINVITHYFFDDYLTAANLGGLQVGTGNTARVLWLLDFSGIYPGILASSRVVAETGNLKTMASINVDFACVMKVPTREQTLTSVTWTIIVECPSSNLIVENFSSQVPEAVILVGNYSGTTTTTTTTAA